MNPEGERLHGPVLGSEKLASRVGNLLDLPRNGRCVAVTLGAGQIGLESQQVRFRIAGQG
jgi:hypothetical protein